MNKKGFTLVELLAVIAILAILVIIAMPNVMGMFQGAKKNTFVTELQTIYRSAQTQYITDSMYGATTEYYYGRNDSKPCTNEINEDINYGTLDLSGSDEINYYIIFAANGTVTDLVATNGAHQYAYHGTGLAIEDIDANGVQTISDLAETDVFTLGDTAGICDKVNKTTTN